MRALLLAAALLFSLPAWALPAAGTQGMVSSAHPAATEAGVAMLRQGGNAADAAAATAFALAVVEPYSSGIGGGGFALVRMGEDVRFLDFREVAPQAATRDMYVRDGEVDPKLSLDGPLAVAVPGAIAGYLELHARWGKLPRATVLAPAIRLAEEGVLVDERYRLVAGWRAELLRQDPDAAAIFLQDGQVPELGWRLVQKDLARTLRTLAAQGPEPFYRGALAQATAADLQARGGILTAADLASYQVRDREPLVGSYLGHAVATAPLPSYGGATILTVLNVLETLPTSTPWRDPAALHLMIEASKRAFADRQVFGDPAFVDAPIEGIVSKGRALRLLQEIGWKATPAGEVPPLQGVEGEETPRAPADPGAAGAHTSHLSVIDANGDAVSLTTTLNTPFGAGVVVKGTGILLNNEMDDFASAPGVPNAYGIPGSEANAIAPGKVPLSSMSPTIVFSGPTLASPVRMVVGSPGGSRIPTSVLQVILAHLAHGAPVDVAVAQGRVHQQLHPEELLVEPFALDAATLGLLRLRGHRIQQSDRRWSNVTVIAVDPETGVRTGAADPRGVGTAAAQ